MNFENDVGSLQHIAAMELRYQNIMNFIRRPGALGNQDFRNFQDLRRLRELINRQEVAQQVNQPRNERINIDSDILSYQVNEHNKVGLYVTADPLTSDNYYFEIEILDLGQIGAIGVGLVPRGYHLDAQPGWRAMSVGYHADDGKLFKSEGFGKPFGPVSQVGDKLGCGIKFCKDDDGETPQQVKVFFTHNRKEVGIVMVQYPPGGLFPAVGMHSEGEEVKLNLDAEWHYNELVLMAVDSGEDEWSRLHDVKLNGSLLEYNGRGKSIHDVGLAQARFPLDTTNHYFEIEIVDPGENCYIAIGVAKKTYPKNRHPGWNKGSIAYHADDGKIFNGSGIGDHFGPRCNKGDVMGCGILFPPDYDSEADSDLSPDDPDVYNDVLADENYSDDDDDDLYDEVEGRPVNGQPPEDGTLVCVFFTCNGKIIGKKPVCIPKGGFYPTVGMLSNCEKVAVDFRPLTG
ncbi:SPRY domain-containing protein 3-like [Mytilus californianus]|uniref:SPRY domain-containing protein 3-like n=1 Tax=Mytilus californianus TaxID=6549 RepID=UPI002245F156|nr:SPRY domain-containing protein 3-like [Mytilus californianus]